MPSQKSDRLKEHVAPIFETLAALYPNPQTELEYGNPLQLLIAVLLSAQTTDKAVNKATKQFFRDCQTARDVVSYSVEELEQIFKSIGLYRTKARHVHALAQILLERYQGQVPLSEEALMSLPGVGRKTAHVVLNTLLNAPLIAVDTHVYRVSKRLGLADASDRDTVGQQLMQIIPERFIIAAHHYLIAHGRQTCQARKPQCSNCRLQQWCHFYQTL